MYECKKSVCMCVYICMCGHICVCVYTYLCVCVNVYVCKCITVASLARATLCVWAGAEEVTPTSTDQQAAAAGVENVRQKKQQTAAEEKPLLIISSLKMEPCLGIECKICCHSFSSEQEHGCAVFNETAASWKISQNWKGGHFHGFALFCIGLNFIALHYT